MSNAVRSRMTHRALVERNGSDDTDRYATPGWATHIEEQPCWLTARSSRESVSPTESKTLDDLTLLLPLGVDITATDRINGITDRLGNVIIAGIFDISGEPLPHADHLEVPLVRASKGGNR